MPPLYFHVTYRQNDVIYHVEFSILGLPDCALMGTCDMFISSPVN